MSKLKEAFTNKEDYEEVLKQYDKAVKIVQKVTGDEYLPEPVTVNYRDEKIYLDGDEVNIKHLLATGSSPDFLLASDDSRYDRKTIEDMVTTKVYADSPVSDIFSTYDFAGKEFFRIKALHDDMKKYYEALYQEAVKNIVRGGHCHIGGTSITVGNAKNVELHAEISGVDAIALLRGLAIKPVQSRLLNNREYHKYATDITWCDNERQPGDDCDCHTWWVGAQDDKWGRALIIEDYDLNEMWDDHEASVGGLRPAVEFECECPVLAPRKGDKVTIMDTEGYLVSFHVLDNGLMLADKTMEYGTYEFDCLDYEETDELLEQFHESITADLAEKSLESLEKYRDEFEKRHRNDYSDRDI